MDTAPFAPLEEVQTRPGATWRVKALVVSAIGAMGFVGLVSAQQAHATPIQELEVDLSAQCFPCYCNQYNGGPPPNYWDCNLIGGTYGTQSINCVNSGGGIVFAGHTCHSGCTNGVSLPHIQRTADNQCASCDVGYHLSGQTCVQNCFPCYCNQYSPSPQNYWDCNLNGGNYGTMSINCVRSGGGVVYSGHTCNNALDLTEIMASVNSSTATSEMSDGVAELTIGTAMEDGHVVAKQTMISHDILIDAARKSLQSLDATGSKDIPDSLVEWAASAAFNQFQEHKDRTLS